jgi:hypothetical protein
MSSDFTKKKRMSHEREKIGSKDFIEIDVMLEMVTQILRKEDQEKCICSNIIPEIDNINVFQEIEIIPSIQVQIIQDKIKIIDVITKLKICGYPLTGAMVSVFYPDIKEYIFMGSDPLDNSILIPEKHFEEKILKIRVLCYVEEKLIPSAQFDKNRANSLGLRFSRGTSATDKKKTKRTKERKIGYIIEKVNTWRKLYNGFYDEYGKFTKYSLDEAAKIIGISKKSLDDYLLQLRMGRKYGFDFNSNKHNKVGVLRSFVKTIIMI